MLTPVSYDNSMDGEQAGESLIDTTYPMELLSDTAGGFWGVSVGSWLHIDASGDAVRRFNLDEGVPSGAVAAITPTQLVVVSSDAVSGGGVVRIFDTETMSWDVVHQDSRPLGDVTVSGQDVLVVAYDYSATPTFTVARLPLDAGVGAVDITTPLPAIGQIALDADSTGTIHLVTGEHRYTFAADGQLLAEVASRSERPLISVNDRGDVLSSRQGTPQELSSFVAAGSAQARAVIERHADCDPSGSGAAVDHLAIVTAETTVTTPFLCAPAGMTWITDDAFVVSVGDEGGAPLVLVEPPPRPGALS